MTVEATEANIVRLLKPLSKADIFVRPASAIVRGALRLEAGFYGSEGYRALQAMENSGFEIAHVHNVAGVRWFGPFSRIYVDDPARGVPFLSSSEMLAAKLEPKNYLSIALTPNLDRLLVNEGTILVSCSGTIGNVAICTKDHAGVAVSQHAIRVDAKADVDRGVLYAFLLSDLGQFLVTRSKSGSVVESIYQADVETLGFPQLPLRLKERLSSDVNEVCRLREQAAASLREADTIVCPTTGDHRSISGRDLWRSVKVSFVRPASELWAAKQAEGYARLDVTYYKPEVLRLRSQLRATTGRTVGDLAGGVTLIGKTFVEGVHKVEQAYGVPYFTGKELFKTRPIAETFITSGRRALIERLLVTKGTTLITCAGTVAKVMYVRGALEGAAITHDAIRVLPEGKVHPGYVYACLASLAGQAQLQRCSYGSVIPRLYRTHVEDILIPVAQDGGAAVGELVDEAFDLRQQALEKENAAIELFLQSLKWGRSAVEKEWGREYSA